MVEVLDKDDSVFPNTLHWQYGHVLTVFEEALSMGNQEVVDVESMVDYLVLAQSLLTGEMKMFLPLKVF